MRNARRGMTSVQGERIKLHSATSTTGTGTYDARTRLWVPLPGAGAGAGTVVLIDPDVPLFDLGAEENSKRLMGSEWWQWAIPWVPRCAWPPLHGHERDSTEIDRQTGRAQPRVGPRAEPGRGQGARSEGEKAVVRERLFFECNTLDAPTRLRLLRHQLELLDQQAVRRAVLHELPAPRGRTPPARKTLRRAAESARGP